MKAFIERVFKSKKQKQKELIDEIADTEVKDQATEVVVKAVVKKVKPVEVPKIEVPKEVFKKPGHYFPDCNCFKCVRWRNQNA